MSLKTCRSSDCSTKIKGNWSVCIEHRLAYRCEGCGEVKPHRTRGMCLQCYRKSPTVKAAQRNWRMRLVHGMEPEVYEAMLAAQNGVCAGCLKPATSWPLVVDHDHGCCPAGRSCKKCARGLLCVNCNRLLGLAYDDTETLLRLIRYLQNVV